MNVPLLVETVFIAPHHRIPPFPHVWQAYKAWLGVLEKGIGETLLESGFFDATLTSDDDYDEGGNNLYDTYTDYKSRRSAPAAQGYDYRGRDDERGFDYNG